MIASPRPQPETKGPRTLSQALAGVTPDGNLRKTGRRRIRAAFRTRRPAGFTGPESTLTTLTDVKLREYDALVLHGVSPNNAGALAFQVTRQTVFRWLAEGSEEDCVDQRKRELYLRTDWLLGAQAAHLEESAYLYDPTGHLDRGPNTRADWGQRSQQLRLTNHTGDGPPELVHKVITREGGYGTTLLEASEAE